MTGTDESTSLAFCPLRSHLCYCCCVCFFPASDYPLIGPGDSNFVSQEYRSQSLLGWKMEKFLVPDVVVSVSWGKHSWIQGILNSPVADGMREELLTEQLLSWVRTQKSGIIATEFFEKKKSRIYRGFIQSPVERPHKLTCNLKNLLRETEAVLRGGANTWVGVQSLKLTNNIKIYLKKIIIFF